MLEALRTILDIQEYDMKMIRLMRLKIERKRELDNIYSLRKELKIQIDAKEKEVKHIKTAIRIAEGEVTDVCVRIKNLEDQQNHVKKVDEFNALSHQLNTLEKERAANEVKLNSLGDKLVLEEGIFDSLRESLKVSEESSRSLEAEIFQNIESINQEGKQIQGERTTFVDEADPEVLRVYERLLKNRKDRVVVPIEDRACSGCHIMLTAQHENLVRKGERLVFCEHCSRVHYWQESESIEGTVAETKRRRRRKVLQA